MQYLHISNSVENKEQELIAATSWSIKTDSQYKIFSINTKYRTVYDMETFIHISYTQLFNTQGKISQYVTKHGDVCTYCSLGKEEFLDMVFGDRS